MGRRVETSIRFRGCAVLLDVPFGDVAEANRKVKQFEEQVEWVFDPLLGLNLQREHDKAIKERDALRAEVTRLTRAVDARGEFIEKHCRKLPWGVSSRALDVLNVGSTDPVTGRPR